MQLQQGFMTSEMGFSSQFALQKSPIANVAVGSFLTEAANSAARPTSASPQKPTSGASEKLVAMG
jgi:hypothetical protein